MLLLLLLLLATPSLAEISPNDIRVIDGDAIRVYHQQPNVRLVGFNAPEIRRAECETEAELGARATGRLRDLIRAGNLDFIYVQCSCPPATQGHLRATTVEIVERSGRTERMLGLS
jgi:endonuclease YncB( thermonuclease family)